MNGKKTYRTALTIAGSDSGGGAGIQADLKTFSALGVYGMSAITALTAQNTCAVRSVFEVSPQFVAEQLDAIFEDFPVDAVKVGMLHRTTIIEVVADRLIHHQAKNIVLDPVMIAKGGASLLQADAVEALKKYLLPLASVITPNLPEASVLLGCGIATPQDMEKAARDLLKLGSRSVLVKGGHMESFESPDCWLENLNAAPVWLHAPRVQTINIHGTGCTLSAAIAGQLARGSDMESAVTKA